MAKINLIKISLHIKNNTGQFGEHGVPTLLDECDVLFSKTGCPMGKAETKYMTAVWNMAVYERYSALPVPSRARGADAEPAESGVGSPPQAAKRKSLLGHGN